MKKITLFFISVLLGISVSAQLNGSYTVGETGTYATIQEACTALETEGQDGPVIFNIQSSMMTYSESVLLNAVDGNSSANTITFQSEFLDSSTVQVESMTESTFTFNDVSYVSFNHIGLSYGNADGFAYVISVNNGTDYSFDHVNIEQACSEDALRINRNAGLYNISFSDCDVISMYNGIYLRSDDGNVENFSMTNTSLSNAEDYCLRVRAEYVLSNIEISNSEFTSAQGRGAYISSDEGDVEDVSIIENTVNSTNDGIYIYADITARNISIENNTVFANLENFSDWYPTAIEVEGSYGGIENVQVNNNYIESSMDYSDYAIELSSGDFQMTNLEVNDNEVVSGRYGISFDSYGGTNWAMNNNEINSIYSSIDVDSDGPVEGISALGNELTVEIGDGIYVYTEANLNDCIVSGNTIDSEDRGIYLEGYGGGISNCVVENNNLNCSDGRGIEFYSNSNIYDLDIMNNEVDSEYEALYIESGDANIESVNIFDNDFVSVDSYGINIDCEANLDGLTITSNDVVSYYEGVYLYPYYGDLSNTTIDDNSVESTNSTAFYVYTDAGINNFMFTNNDISGRYTAVEVESYYGAMQNVQFTDNYLFSSESNGLELETSYAPIESVLITRNEIYADTINCCDEAIYLESDDSYMNNVTITYNDLYSNGTGMEIEADYGNALNSRFEKNNIWATEIGIEVDGFGSNSSISGNKIYPLATASEYISQGIEVYGYDGPSANARINGNYMENVSSYGIEAEYMEGLELQRNIINGTLGANNLYGVYLYGCYGANALINANQVLVNQESRGIYFSDCVFEIASPASVTNNFVSNMQYSLYVDYSDNINLANNSMSTSNNVNMTYVNESNNISFMNNIFRNHGNTGSMYYFQNSSFLMFDHNAYDFDDSVINFAEGEVYGTLASLADFQTATSMESASLELNLSSVFVDETNDLHLDCATTSLNLGMTLPYLNNDVDGLSRPASNITIGAHEMNGTSPDIFTDPILLCSEVEVEMMNPVSGAFEWSTAQTTPSIFVTTPGTYSITVTDYCGNTHSDDVEVYVDAPDASFLVGSSSLYGLFSNTSTGGTSYEWDFGDGETSTEENPTHLYDTDGTYTVTLSVTDECGNVSTAVNQLSVIFLSTPDWIVEEDINVYPNPTNGIINVNFNHLTGEDIAVMIMDLGGRTVLSDQISLVSGTTQLNLDLTEYANGMYILVLQSEGSRITKKITKN